MPDYSNGKVYAIRSHQTPDVYIGTTTQTLAQRLGGHRTDYARYKAGKFRYVTSFELLNYIDHYIELLENYPCRDKNELERKEGEYIRSMECVNKFIPGRTRKEWLVDNKEHVSRYREQYRENNKSEIHQYYENDKENNHRKMKQYYVAKKNVRTCICGSQYNAGHTGTKTDHFNTNKHTNWVDNFYERLNGIENNN